MPETTTTRTVGRFTFDEATGQVSGPADYMLEHGPKRIAKIERGDDVVAAKAYEYHGDIVLAILVSLQTDYAAFAGYKQMFGTAPTS